MNHAHKRTQQQGFTLVELTLSMAFIAMLLLAIAMLTMQISTLYNKGLTIRAVNEAGQLISSDIQRTLNTASATVKYVENNVSGGRLCTEDMVYAWNYPGHIDAGTFGGRNQLNDGTTGIRMIKYSGGLDACDNSLGAYPFIPPDANSRVDLLNGGDSTLAVQELIVNVNTDGDGKPGLPVVGDSTQRIYTISMRLGSSDTEGLEDAGCAAPASTVDDSYCAVNTFTFTARAGKNGS